MLGLMGLKYHPSAGFSKSIQQKDLKSGKKSDLGIISSKSDSVNHKNGCTDSENYVKYKGAELVMKPLEH